MKNENGLSLLELVISIGLILILGVGGTIGYSAISKNAKQAAVENAASEVIKAVVIKEQTFNKNISFEPENIDYEYKTPQDVADEWMNSAGKGNKVAIDAIKQGDMIGVRAIYNNDEKIVAIKIMSLSGECNFDDNSGGNNTQSLSYDTTNSINKPYETSNVFWGSNIDAVDCSPSDPDTDCPSFENTTASYDFNNGYSVENVLDNCDEEPPIDDGIDNSGPTYDNETLETSNPDYISEFTYNCDATTTGNLLPFNMKETTYSSKLKAFVKNLNNGQITKVEQVQDNVRYYINVTLEAGVDYKIFVFGDYEGLARNLGAGSQYGNLADCLISVDEIAPYAGPTILGQLGGKKLEKVPSSIPTTIKVFSNTFSGATKFNDPNVSNWYIRQAGNVSMSGMFANTDSFNQPLNWDVSYVGDMSLMFEGAKAFNQPLDNWNTSKAYNMTQMFRDAEKFDQDISNWNVSKVTSHNEFSKRSPIEGTSKVPNFNN